VAKRRVAKQAVESPASNSLERYRGLLSETDFSALLAALAQPLPQALRINPLKVQPQAAIAAWQARYGWEVQPVPFCPTGWQILFTPTPLSAPIEFRMGQYYIQDAASMLPAELFDLSGLDAPLVLDMAAAPGGKTTHLISRAGDRGLVLANDSAPGRIGALRGVLRDWGAVNAAVTAYPGERFGSWFPETFDCVLLDAPCSMDHLRPSAGHARRPATAREREGLADRQARLLASALRAARVGGQVVYSTCTLAPEEDEGVLDTLLRQFGDAVQIDDLSARFSVQAHALAADEVHSFHPAVINAMRIWPHIYATSGFFAARLTKTAALEGPRADAPSRPIQRLGWARLDRRETAGVGEFFAAEYGFDLPAVLVRQDLALWRRGSGVHAFPERFMARFAGLPVDGLGLLVGEESPQGFQLSHEWAARFGHTFQAGLYRLPEEHTAAWLRGEDVPLADGSGKTVVVLDQDARNLGRGKMQAQRLKNLLPRRLV
jgi:16S rRNA (cytosine1407-C5)-methyltransferase